MAAPDWSTCYERRSELGADVSENRTKRGELVSRERKLFFLAVLDIRDRVERITSPDFLSKTRTTWKILEET